jgi:hypothetical protein
VIAAKAAWRHRIVFILVSREKVMNAAKPCQKDFGRQRCTLFMRHATCI